MAESNSDLGYKLEKMVQNLLNEFVISDKTFRVSTPVGIASIKLIFGHSLTEKQLAELNRHDGIVALFTLQANDPKSRQDIKSKAQSTISALEPYLGKPVLDVWEGKDEWPNIFGEKRQMYICCFFGLDESGYSNRVLENSK